MIISNNYFRWWPTFLEIAFKSLGADDRFYKSDQLRVWTVLFLKPLNYLKLQLIEKCGLSFQTFQKNIMKF